MEPPVYVHLLDVILRTVALLFYYYYYYYFPTETHSPSSDYLCVRVSKMNSGKLMTSPAEDMRASVTVLRMTDPAGRSTTCCSLQFGLRYESCVILCDVVLMKCTSDPHREMWSIFSSGKDGLRSE